MSTVIVPTLETERLVLRPWREVDHELHARFCADEQAQRFIGGACGPEEAWRRMAVFIGHWQLRGYGPWVITLKGDDRFIGRAGSNFPLGWPEPEIGWSLLAEHQGRGLATEAARAARDHAYRVLGWPTAISLIADGNIGSERVAQRLGAVRERTLDFRGKSAGIWRHLPPDELH